MNYIQLVEKAFEARNFSYSPSSNFMVGAALLGTNGEIYQGCNVECGGLTASCCAERTAFVKAASVGQTSFSAIAIVGARRGTEAENFNVCPPCGVCLQVMMEFCEPETFEVILATGLSEYEVVTLKELLPRGFAPAWKNKKV